MLGSARQAGLIPTPCAGADRLKAVLQARGLKSGGTLAQRAQRLFLTKETPLHKLDRKHFAPGAPPAAALEPARAAALLQASKEAAFVESKVGLRDQGWDVPCQMEA